MVITTRYQRVYVGSIPTNRSNNKTESGLQYAKIQKTFSSNSRELQTQV